MSRVMASGGVSNTMAQPLVNLSKSDEKKNQLKTALIMSSRQRVGVKMANSSTIDPTNHNQAVKLSQAIQHSARIISPQVQETNTTRSSKKRKGAAAEHGGELGSLSVVMTSSLQQKQGSMTDRAPIQKIKSSTRVVGSRNSGNVKMPREFGLSKGAQKI